MVLLTYDMYVRKNAGENVTIQRFIFMHLDYNFNKFLYKYFRKMNSGFEKY